MSGSKFDLLAALILSGEATPKQEIEFEEILKTSKEKQIAFEKLKRVWEVDLGNHNKIYDHEKERLWFRYQSARNSLKAKQQSDFFRRVAAAIVLLAIAGFTCFLLYKQNFDQSKTVAVKNIVKETQSGEKLKTQLPDGTNVYLNSGSQLIYPENFSDSNRIVQFKGEGYFDVAEDKNRPFTVRTQTMDITALGTAFSVNVYHDDSLNQVALVTGKLLIKSIKNQKVRIDSGETATLSKVDYSFSTSKLDYLNQVAWKDGILNFDNNSFEEIVGVLELNYGVKFMLHRDINSVSGTYTGSFKNESLDNILKVLSFSMDFKYKINGKEVSIMSNEKPGT